MWIGVARWSVTSTLEYRRIRNAPTAWNRCPRHGRSTLRNDASKEPWLSGTPQRSQLFPTAAASWATCGSNYRAENFQCSAEKLQSSSGLNHDKDSSGGIGV